MPELTSIQLGCAAFCFDDWKSWSELIVRSDDDGTKLQIDLPKLTSLTAKGSGAFRNPRHITLEGISYHSILTNRYAIPLHCYSSERI